MNASLTEEDVDHDDRTVNVDEFMGLFDKSLSSAKKTPVMNKFNRSSSISLNGTARSVKFGSPQAVEFDENRPANSAMTPLAREFTKSLYKMDESGDSNHDNATVDARELLDLVREIPSTNNTSIALKQQQQQQLQSSQILENDIDDDRTVELGTLADLVNGVLGKTTSSAPNSARSMFSTKSRIQSLEEEQVGDEDRTMELGKLSDLISSSSSSFARNKSEKSLQTQTQNGKPELNPDEDDITEEIGELSDLISTHHLVNQKNKSARIEAKERGGEEEEEEEEEEDCTREIGSLNDLVGGVFAMNPKSSKVTGSSLKLKSKRKRRQSTIGGMDDDSHNMSQSLNLTVDLPVPFDYWYDGLRPNVVKEDLLLRMITASFCQSHPSSSKNNNSNMNGSNKDENEQLVWASTVYPFQVTERACNLELTREIAELKRTIEQVLPNDPQLYLLTDDSAIALHKKVLEVINREWVQKKNAYRDLLQTTLQDNFEWIQDDLKLVQQQILDKKRKIEALQEKIKGKQQAYERNKKGISQQAALEEALNEQESLNSQYLNIKNENDKMRQKISQLQQTLREFELSSNANKQEMDSSSREQDLQRSIYHLSLARALQFWSIRGGTSDSLTIELWKSSFPGSFTRLKEGIIERPVVLTITFEDHLIKGFQLFGEGEFKVLVENAARLRLTKYISAQARFIREALFLFEHEISQKLLLLV